MPILAIKPPLMETLLNLFKEENTGMPMMLQHTMFNMVLRDQRLTLVWLFMVEDLKYPLDLLLDPSNQQLAVLLLEHMKLMYSTIMISRRTILQQQMNSMTLLRNQLIFMILLRVSIFHMIMLNQLLLKFNW